MKKMGKCMLSSVSWSWALKSQPEAQPSAKQSRFLQESDFSKMGQSKSNGKQAKFFLLLASLSSNGTTGGHTHWNLLLRNYLKEAPQP